MKTNKIDFSTKKSKERVENLRKALEFIQVQLKDNIFTGPTVNVLFDFNVCNATGVNVTLQKEGYFTRLKQIEPQTFVTFPSIGFAALARQIMQKTKDDRAAYAAKRKEQDRQNKKQVLNSHQNVNKQLETSISDIEIDFEQVMSEEKRLCSTDAQNALKAIFNFVVKKRAFPESNLEDIESFIVNSDQVHSVWTDYKKNFLSINL